MEDSQCSLRKLGMLFECVCKPLLICKLVQLCAVSPVSESQISRLQVVALNIKRKEVVLSCVELMSTEVCGIADGNQMRIKMCVVFLLI